MQRYSRQNPTPHYWQLLKFYQQMHATGGYRQAPDEREPVQFVDGAEIFRGESLLLYAGLIRRMISQTESRSILDYGAGKGIQYDPAQATGNSKPFDARQYWGVAEIHTYEPGLNDRVPKTTADGVISVDVLEHCFHADIPWIVEEMFSLANKFVWCAIDCIDAKQLLPNCENAHITVRTPGYWHGLFDAISNRFSDIDWKIACRHADNGQRLVQLFGRQPVADAIDASTQFKI